MSRRISSRDSPRRFKTHTWENETAEGDSANHPSSPSFANTGLGRRAAGEGGTAVPGAEGAGHGRGGSLRLSVSL